MEGSESSINRIGRTIWTVWGYLTGAVGRYLRPESPNKDNQDAPFEQEEAISNVTHKSYKELKEDEEKEEKSETEAWPQREKPQSGISVRTAAVQWEKMHSGDTSKRTCTGVVWNAAVQKEVLDKKAQEQRDTEETLDNNKAVQTKSNDVFEKADPASTDADMGSPDFGVPRSLETDAEDKGDENDVDAEDKEDENVIDDVVESEHAENEEEEILEEECDFGDEVNIRELSLEKVLEHTEDQDENEEDEDKQRNQGMTRDEDEASTHMADDLSSQLTCSTREREDLLNKEIKVDGEYIGETMEHEASTTPEREVVDVSDEETEQETLGIEKNEQQGESKLDEAQIEFPKEMVETECKLLDELKASEEAEHTSCSVESESTPTSERVAIEAKIQDTVGTVKDGQHEAGQQSSVFKGSKSSDELDICESQLDGAQNDLTQGIVGTTCEPLQEPMTRQMANAEIYEKEPEPLCIGVDIKAELTPERGPIDGLEETNQVTVGTVKDVEHEAGQELSESNVVEAIDICDSKLDEKCMEETIKNEAAMTPEREGSDSNSEEIKQGAVEMVQDGQHELSQQLNESKATETKLDESQIEVFERMVETECKLLEELVASQDSEHTNSSTENGSTPTSERVAIEAKIQDTVGTVKDGQHEAGQQSSESEGSKSSDELDICESKLDGAQNDFTQGIVSTTCEPLQEPMTREMANAEIYEKEPEPLCKGVEIKAELTPERGPIDGLEETKQGTVGTVKDVEHEAGQELSESNVVGTVNVCDSNLDEKCIEEATEIEAAMTPERGPIDDIEETNQGTVGRVKDVEHEAGQELSESRVVEAVDIYDSKLDEKCMEETTENEAAMTLEREGSDTNSEEIKQGTVEMVQDGQHELSQQLNESKATETKLDESQIEFVERMVETEGKLLEELVASQEAEHTNSGIENGSTPTSERVAIEAKIQDTVGTVIDGQHEAGQQSSESEGSKCSDELDICESKLDGAQNDLTQGIVGTTCEPLQEPMTRQMANAELYEKEPEPLCKGVEIKAELTPERGPTDGLEETNQGTVGTVKDVEHEAGQELSESNVVETVDVCDSNLDEKCIEEATENEAAMTPERVPTDGLEETNQGTVGRVKDVEHEAGQELSESHVVEAIDIYDSKLDEKCMEETTENEAAMTPEREGSDTNSEEIKQGTVEMVQDGQHELSQQLNESKATETKLDESQIEFVERMVETESKLLEELVTGQLENEETCKEEEEPITEHKAAVTPERELIDTIEVTKSETVGTAKDRQHEMGHQLRQFRGFENADKPDIRESNLVESQNKNTDGRAETKYELLEEFVTGQMENAEKEAELISKGGPFKLASGDERGDSDLTAVIMEADQVEHEEETEAGNTSETEVELLDIIGSQLPEKVIKQDSELVAAGPGNQSGTSQTISNFSQEVRAEVAADNVKKSTERVRSLQPTAREKCAPQETLGQWTLEQGSLQEMSIDGNASESGLLEALFTEMQRFARKSSSAEEVNEAAFCEAPSSSPQELDDTQDTTETSAEMVTELTMDETEVSFTEQKMEVLEMHSELTTASDHDVAEVKCELSKAETGPQTEVKSYSATVEMLKQSSEAEAPVPDDRSESQIPLNCGEWTVQGGSGGETEPCGQIKHSGASDLPERETVSETLEMLRNPQKDAEDAELKEFKMFELKGHPEKEGENPDEAKIGMLDEIKAITASLEDVEEIMSGLTQGSEERLEAGTIKTREEETAMEASESDRADLQTHNELLSNLEENKNNLHVETIDVDSEVCGKTESMKEKLQNAPEEHEDHASKVDEGETAVDSNKSLQERSRSGLKRGSEQMARNEEAKPSVAKGWAALEQLKGPSLDCTVQKSKIAVKNRFTRPPKNPRTLINMISAEPSVAPRPSQPSVLKKAQGVGPSVLPPGVIGFKLPGLGGGGLPVLRKTDAGKKMRDDGDAQSVTTQKSDSQTDPKEDCGKKELPANKPKWTPPRHPGMGNPLMMSELKSKLKKTGKD